MRKTKSLCNVLGVALIVGALASAAGAKTFEFDYHKEVELKQSSTLRVENGAGNITITGSRDVDHLIINAVKTVHAVDEAAAKEVSGFVELKLSTKKHEVMIETIVDKVEDRRRSFWDRLIGSDDEWFEAVDYVITAPRDVRVEIVNSSGSVTVTGLDGYLEISAAAGEVTVKDVASDVTLDLTSGSIEVSQVNGDIEITTTRAEATLTNTVGALTVPGGSGSLKADYLTGDATIIQTSGDATLTHYRGDARVKLTSGKISVEQESGSLDLFTHTGKVVVQTELYSEKEYSLETLSAPVEFSFPDNTGASIHLSSLSGEIDTRGLPLEVDVFSRQEIRGTIGVGGTKISIKSDAGDIRMQWR
jgi:hypothetical protein